MKQLHQAAFEAAPLAMLVVDAEGAVVLLNRQAEVLFDYGRAELLGRPIELLVPESARIRHAELRASFFHDPSPRGMGVGRDVDGRRRDGTIVPLEIGLNPIVTDDGVRVIVSLVDLSSRKRAEATLLREQASLGRAFRAQAALLEELEKAQRSLVLRNQDLQSFAYVASHDLQEPLRTIRSFVGMIGDQYADRMDERGTRWLSFLAAAAERAQALVRSLLAYSRVETQAAAFGPVELRVVAALAIANLNAAIADSGAVVTVGDLPRVVADREQMAQLFQNLLGNAIKFRRGPGPQIRVSATASGDGWTVAVADDGIGIPAEFEQQVFELFRRLHSADEHPGAGMGLAICQRIVRRHGGQIWVEAAEGGGTVVFFTLLNDPERADVEP